MCSLRTRNFSQTEALVKQGKLNISTEALDVLRVMRRSGQELEVPKGFKLSTLADLQKGAQVEFAVIRKTVNEGGQQVSKRFLVRGLPDEVFIPKGATRVVAHTHPGGNIYAVRPSVDDATFISKLGQRSSLVITEEGYFIRFSSTRDIISNRVYQAQ